MDQQGLERGGLTTRAPEASLRPGSSRLRGGGRGWVQGSWRRVCARRVAPKVVAEVALGVVSSGLATNSGSLGRQARWTMQLDAVVLARAERLVPRGTAVRRAGPTEHPASRCRPVQSTAEYRRRS